MTSIFMREMYYENVIHEAEFEPMEESSSDLEVAPENESGSNEHMGLSYEQYNPCSQSVQITHNNYFDLEGVINRPLTQYIDLDRSSWY